MQAIVHRLPNQRMVGQLDVANNILQASRRLREDGHEHVVGSVVFTPDGRRAVSGSWDQSLRVWDLETGRELARVDSQSWVGPVMVSPDGQYILAGGG